MNDGDDEEAKHDTLPAAAPPPENPTGGSNQEPSAEEAGTKDEFEQQQQQQHASLLRIMTNAHSVEYGSLVQVHRLGDDRKYTAQLETLAKECDLASFESR